MAKKAVEKKKFGGKQEGAGRPLKEIDEVMLAKLARTLLPVSTISDILCCSPDVLERRFSGILQEGRANRKYSLVEAMWDKALNEKDTKMQIWLSKQHLGYKDIQPEEATQVHFNVYTNEVPR